jgi:hypothetical protein
MRRYRLDCYELFYAATGVWRGFRCLHDGVTYREIPVVVDDLMALPVTARVRIENSPWVRP